MSATHRRSGASGVKLRFTRRSGAGGVRSACARKVVRAFLLRPPHPNKPGFPHQTSYALSSASYSKHPQLEVDPRSTIGLSAISVNANDLLHKQRASALARAEGALCPSSHRNHSLKPSEPYTYY